MELTRGREFKGRATAAKRTPGQRSTLFLLGATCLLFAAAAFADDGEHYPMRFDRLSLEQGLSQSNVLDVHQDSEGYIWIGTENGLNRYDGYTFKHYRRERGNPDALANDFIFDIAEDKRGALWLATNGGGLARMDRKTGKFQSWRSSDDAASLGSNIVRRVFIDADDSVWVGTRGAGLAQLDAESGTFTHFRFADDASRDNVFAIMRDSTGALWVGGDFGLATVDTETGKTQMLGDFKHVRAVFEDGAGTVWVGTHGKGLSRFDRETGSFTSFTHSQKVATSIAGNRVTSIFEDSDGRLWVGTTAGLNLLHRESGEFARYNNIATDPMSLGGNSITVVYEDRGGMLWVGTKMRGLNKWNPRTWAYGLENSEQLSTSGEQAPSVMALVEDSGTLWVGTYGEGLNSVDRETGEVTKYRHDPKDPATIGDNRVMSLMLGSDERIWVGTMTRGIDRLNPADGSIDRLQHDPEDPASLSANGIMTMVEASDGRVWVGTFGGGISIYDQQTGRFERLAHDPDNLKSLSGNRVTSIAEDESGNMWIGTDGAGLNLYESEAGTFHRFRHDPNDPTALSDDTIYSLKIDADGNVWVGTRGGGLDRVIGSAATPATIRFENRSQAEGLANDVIYGIEADRTGTLWLSTNFGLSRYDAETDTFNNLHRRDGLQSEEFNFGAHHMSQGGELFFGGTDGYNAFNPGEIARNEIAPNIVLTDFSNGGDGIKSDLPISEDGTIELTHKHDTVSFEFAALDFATPSANRYMYRLDGFDKDWVDLGTRRRVTYTDLDDGRYLLRVKASNADGVWNEAGFAVPIHVSPSPWNSWWAYLGYAAAFMQLVALLWFAHRNKIRREEEYSHRLEMAVVERTDMLSERNRQLKELNEALQESSLSDPLTGLRNRRFVFEEVSRDFEVIQRRNADEFDGIDQSDAADLVFMMIDLDNFKPINDTYGHAAGDQMLLEVRDLLLGTCRRSDFVVRWGGDEFVIIAKQARPGECEALAERIRKTIGEHNFMLDGGQIVRTTCSIGFAAYPLFRAGVDESNLDQIIGLADALMYEAKKQRNAWAGMFGPNEAATSFSIPEDALEPTSVLFRARRAGTLACHTDNDEQLSLTEAG